MFPRRRFPVDSDIIGHRRAAAGANTIVAAHQMGRQPSRGRNLAARTVNYLASSVAGDSGSIGLDGVRLRREAAPKSQGRVLRWTFASVRIAAYLKRAGRDEALDDGRRKISALGGGEMKTLLKTAFILGVTGGFAISSVIPLAAEEEQVRFYNSPAATAARLPFSQAVRVGDVLYMSGSIGNLPGKAELVPGGIEPETKQMMENIREVLQGNGLTFDDVFKCTAMLADMSKWGAFNKIYVTYFKPEHLPARSALGANGLALGAQVELECWAFARK